MGNKRTQEWVCVLCGLLKRKVPRFQEGECPKGIQHDFVLVKKKEKHGLNSRKSGLSQRATRVVSSAIRNREQEGEKSPSPASTPITITGVQFHKVASPPAPVPVPKRERDGWWLLCMKGLALMFFFLMCILVSVLIAKVVVA